MPYFLIQVPGDRAFLMSDQQISLRLISNELKAVSWKTNQLPSHPGMLAFLQMSGWILRRQEFPQLLCLKSWAANKAARTLFAETLGRSAWKAWDTNTPCSLLFPRAYNACRSSRPYSVWNGSLTLFLEAQKLTPPTKSNWILYIDVNGQRRGKWELSTRSGYLL